MHPILFHIGPLPVATYGVMIMFGVIGAMMLAHRMGRRPGIPAEFFDNLAMVVVFAGLIGARLLYIAVSWDEFAANPLGVLFSRSGLVFLGGLGAAIPAAVWYIRKRKMAIWEVADIAGPAVPLAHAFGRIGCFNSGCCYGRVVSSESFCAVRFPRLDLMAEAQGKSEKLVQALESFTLIHHDHMRRGLITADSLYSAPVIPIQLIESMVNLTLALILVWLWSRRRFPGQVFAAYLMSYGAARFLLEYLRDDARGSWLWGALSTSQLGGLVAILAGCILWGVLKSRQPVGGSRTAQG